MTKMEKTSKGTVKQRKRQLVLLLPFSPPKDTAPLGLLHWAFGEFRSYFNNEDYSLIVPDGLTNINSWDCGKAVRK